MVPTPPGYRPGPPAPSLPPPKIISAAVLQPIYFDLNKSVIRPDAAETLKENFEWFRQNPGKKVRNPGKLRPKGNRKIQPRFRSEKSERSEGVPCRSWRGCETP